MKTPTVNVSATSYFSLLVLFLFSFSALSLQAQNRRPVLELRVDVVANGITQTSKFFSFNQMDGGYWSDSDRSIALSPNSRTYALKFYFMYNGNYMLMDEFDIREGEETYIPFRKNQDHYELFLNYPSNRFRQDIKLHFRSLSYVFEGWFQTEVIWYEPARLINTRFDPAVPDEKDDLTERQGQVPDDFSVEGGRLKASPAARFAIQVAAMKSGTRLDTYDDLTPFANVYMTKEKGLYKYRVGLFSSRAIARELLDDIRRKGYRSAFIVEEYGEVLDILN